MHGVSVGEGESTLGILNPCDGLRHFRLERRDPCAELRPFISNYWSTAWDLRERSPFSQEVLPHPCVNLVFEAERTAVHGPAAQRFVAHLSGRGWVFGVKFTPTGFQPFARVAMAALVDHFLPLADGMRCDTARARELIALVRRHDDPWHHLRDVEAFLLEQGPTFDPERTLAEQLVARARTDRSIARSEQLASEAALSLRSLHRLFERYVGVGPKWIIRRARVQEAAERVATGNKVDWAALAQELGYHDQSHLVRDFKEQLGFTPAAYAARCEAAANSTAAVPRSHSKARAGT